MQVLTPVFSQPLYEISLILLILQGRELTCGGLSFDLVTPQPARFELRPDLTDAIALGLAMNNPILSTYPLMALCGLGSLLSGMGALPILSGSSAFLLC